MINVMVALTLWGPIVYGSGPLAYGKSTGPKLKEARPKLKARKHKVARKYSRGQFRPRQTQIPMD